MAIELDFRKMWIADDENSAIIVADYSQQEPRIMAQLSGDKKMIEACNSQDVYIEFARMLYGCEVAKDSRERYIAKQFVLATSYGVGSSELSHRHGIPLEECNTVRQHIKRTFPVMAQFCANMERQALTYGYVTTVTGRRRYFKKGEKRLYTEAGNFPIQGTAADMFKLAMAKIYQWLTEEKKSGNIKEARILNIVHDEIVAHCHKDDAKYVKENVCRLMEEAGKALCPAVSHYAEANISTCWEK
jgi:DNA polymerase-1